MVTCHICRTGDGQVSLILALSQSYSTGSWICLWFIRHWSEKSQIEQITLRGHQRLYVATLVNFLFLTLFLCLSMQRHVFKRHEDLDMETLKVLLAEALVYAQDFGQEYQKELMRLSNACTLSLWLQYAVLSIAETPICPLPWAD